MFLTKLIVFLSLCAVVFLASQYVNEIILRAAYSIASEEDLQVLANIDEDELPEPLMHIVKRSEPGEHLCCRNTPIAIIKKSRRVRRVTVVKDKIKTGTSHCGTLGIHTCDTYSYQYRQVISYVTEYYLEPQTQHCPRNDIVCCNMYLMVNHKCVHLDDLKEVAATLLG